MSMNKNSKIYIAGHTGLVGRNIVEFLGKEGYSNIITFDRKEVNLLNQVEVSEMFRFSRPEYVFLCAAKVGGIKGNNDYSADFIFDNIQIQSNIISHCHCYEVKKLLFLGSSCIYPRDAENPIKEDQLLTGPLEETNKAYAVAKIAGITMCQMYNKQYGTNFISAMPCNLTGKYDSYNENGHMFPSLIKRFHQAKIDNKESVVVWGTGKPRRECLLAEELAECLVFLMNNYSSSEIINVGSGQDWTILEISKTIADVVGYEGKIEFDSTKADGTMKKLVSLDKIKSLGWEPKMNLKERIEKTYRYFLRGEIKNESTN